MHRWFPTGGDGGDNRRRRQDVDRAWRERSKVRVAVMVPGAETIFDDEPRTTFEADHRPARKVGTDGCLLYATRALGVSRALNADIVVSCGWSLSQCSWNAVIAVRRQLPARPVARSARGRLVEERQPRVHPRRLQVAGSRGPEGVTGDPAIASPRQCKFALSVRQAAAVAHQRSAGGVGV